LERRMASCCRARTSPRHRRPPVDADGGRIVGVELACSRAARFASRREVLRLRTEASRRTTVPARPGKPVFS
jgi:hypothetical protein